MTPQSTQAGPAILAGPASPNGAPPIALRPSVALRGVTVVFILIAVAAVQACLAARLGALQAAPAALAALALLALGASLHWRAEPGAIKIGVDSLTVWNRAGETLAQGRIAGGSQWTGRLLILALAGERGRSRSHAFLIPADALAADAFRELAVLGRRRGRV